MEAVILFAIGLVLLGAISGIIFDQLSVYYAQQQQKQAFNVVNSLAKEIDDAYFISPGTVKEVSVNIPESVDLSGSHMSGRELLLRVNGMDVVATTRVDVVGEWPGRDEGSKVFVRAMEGFVSVSIQPLEFYPPRVIDSIKERSSGDFNLFVTNLDDYAATFDYSSDLSSSALSVSSSPDFGELTVLSEETVRLGLSFSCAANSVGQYSGNMLFVGDNNFSVPFDIRCISEQEKLSIFPYSKSMTASAGDVNSDSVLVCNSSSEDFSSSSAVITGSISQYVFTSFSGAIPANSCRQLDLNITPPLSAGNFAGVLEVSSGGFSDEAELGLAVS